MIPLLALATACNLSPSALTGNLPKSPTSALPDSTAAAVTAAAAHEPLVPDPSPPAYKDEEGKVHGPGGPVSADPGDCGPAHNHCMRGNAYFSNGVTDKAHTANPRAPVFQMDGHWYSWKGKPADGGTLYRTKPATAENLNGAREVYMFYPAPTDKATADSSLTYGDPPASEKEALTSGRWGRIDVYKIDAAKGTFSASDGLTYRIDAARIGFDPRGTD